STQFTDQLAPVLAEVTARSGAPQLHVNVDRDGEIGDAYTIRTQAGDWSLEQFIAAYDEDPLPTETRVQLPPAARADDLRAVLIACLPEAPEFVDMDAVASLGGGPASIAVTGYVRHRAVEITAGDRRLLFFEEGCYTYQERLPDIDFEDLKPE